jgi:hypothetical protein
MPFGNQPDHQDTAKQCGDIASPVANQYGIKINRQQCQVQITLIAGDEYVAIQLYETLVEAISGGKLNLAAVLAARSPATP